MTPLSHLSNSWLLVGWLAAFFACAPGGQGPVDSNSGQPANPGAPPSPQTFENPFLSENNEPMSGPCLALNLEAPAGKLPAEIVAVNSCDHAVAVLTSPLEVRVRRTGTAPMVYERSMLGSGYAILYAVSAEIEGDPFRGDGVIRDGGFQVKRPPGYSTVDAKATIRIPLRCQIDAPPGKYYLPMMTYEAQQGTAAVRSDPFDCSNSVEKHNLQEGRELDIRLGAGVRAVSIRSTSIQL